MISPHTPPGTHLVVTWQAITEEDAVSVTAPPWKDKMRVAWARCVDKPEFDMGQRVVLDRVLRMEQAACGYAAVIVGHSGYYCLELFSVATLPSVLTDLLVAEKKPENA